MKFFDTISNFLSGGEGSLRWDTVSRKVCAGELSYVTAADSRRAMRDDAAMLKSDFLNSIRLAESHVEKSRTK